MGRSRRFVEVSERIEKESSAATGFWADIMPKIQNGKVIPIISNSFRIEQIFREEPGQGEAPPENKGPDEFTIFEELTAAWAQKIRYPMHDKHNLARVAQYFLVEEKDDPNARTKYLEFLKSLLLGLAAEDKNYRAAVERLRSQIQTRSFSDIASELDYPRISEEKDALRILAKLPIKTFITTSQSDFLERALLSADKQPVTQICFWFGDDNTLTLADKHKVRPDYDPDKDHPLVYHLYGLEDYAQSLVMSEDDYVTFLVNTMEGDTNNLNPIVPLSLRRAIGESQLILLGYRLRDWEFRALFRFLVKWRKDDFSPRGMVIQLREEEKNIEDVEKALKHLGNYFDRKKFDIEWNNAESFIQKLYAEWNDWNAQGQKQS